MDENAPEITDEEAQPSRKREFAATVVATTVALVLGVGTSIIIDKVKNRVHDRIANPPTDTYIVIETETE